MTIDERGFDLSAPHLENFAVAIARALQAYGLDLEFADPRLQGDPKISPAEIADQVMPNPIAE